MRRKREPLQIYKHKKLMDEVNNFFIAIKAHFYIEGLPDAMLRCYPKPMVESLDDLTHRIISALGEQSEDMIKY